MALSGISESGTLQYMRVSMRSYGADGVLDTRSGGAEARWAIEREMTSAGQTEALVLDFEGVRAVTVSFADECLGNLLAGRATSYYDDHPVLAVHANEDVRETLAMTLGRRRLALLHVGGPPVLLGADDILNNTLSVAWDLRQFTAAQLAKELKISAQAANNRLKALVAMGALRRALIIPRGGGKEFAYTIPETGMTPKLPTASRRRKPRRGKPAPA